MTREQLIKNSAWVFGPVASAIIPSLSAPLEPETFPFFWAGCGAMLVGFLAERFHEAGWFLSGIAKSKLFISSAAGFLIFGTIYFVMLSAINTPSVIQEGFQFSFFLIYSLCGGYVVSLAHRHGASFIIEKFS
ncbi:MAG: hypothetical protein ACU0BN_08110 [Sulfitobacter sp.]|uniref:hypothetical protein n=1 Tax=Sulfitobacter sp. TaxID=1903071 RepID=UPI00405A07AE